jgi:carbon-monoxide dehydrogenase large subunit
MKFGIGQPVKRVEDKNLLLGRGRYSDDQLPGEGAAVTFVRMPYGHARLTRLDLSEAKAADGVLLAAGQADLDADNIGEIECQHFVTNQNGSEVPRVSKPPMIRDVGRHAGDIVAMIVAETRQQALDAAELVIAEFDELPAVTGVKEAQASAAPQIHAEFPGNIAFDWTQGKTAEVDDAIEAAEKAGKRVVRAEIVNNRVAPSSMETRPMLAMPDPEDPTGQALRIYSGSQGPVPLARQLSKALNMEQDQVHILTGNVGGSFGFKIFLHPEQLCIAWAARKLGRLVRWQQDRSEAFLSDLMGRDNLWLGEAVVEENGRISALRMTSMANLGSWLSNFSIFVPTSAAARSITGVYDLPVASFRALGVITNTPATDAYRGAGRPEANYAIERMIDIVAAELGLDRLAVRKENLIQPEQIPYKMAQGGEIDSGDMPALLDAALDQADRKGFEARRKQALSEGKWLGIGWSMYLEVCGGGLDNGVDVQFQPDGQVHIYASQMENGQGHQTTLTQLFADRLGYDPALVTILQGDSRKNPAGTTGGARMTPVLGSATAEAGDKIAQNARALAAELLETAEQDIRFEEGLYLDTKSNRSIRIEELVIRTADEDADHPLNMKNSYEANGLTYPYGCHVAEIEVDMATFVPQLTRYTVVDDFGLVINPLTLGGQIHGGIAQGVGQALYEYMPYDSAGQLLAGSLMDYTLPRADHLPSFDVGTRNTPCLNNYLGAKGAGEAGAIGAPPAVISALCDALSLSHIDMPATPQRIFEAIKAKEKAA